MPRIGRRIVVCGPPSAGKTTVAKRISQSVGVPHIELDAIFWTPNWVSKPLEQFRADVSSALADHPDGRE